MPEEASAIDVYYDMDIAQICQHFNKSRNTVDKAIAKLVKDNPDKDWKDGEGLKVVKRGSTKHYNFNSKECKQKIKITKDAYDYFISDEAPSFIKKSTWLLLKERIFISLNQDYLFLH